MPTNNYYETLLADAQKQRNILDDVLAEIRADRYQLSVSGVPIDDQRQIECDRRESKAKCTYTRWIDENLTKLGITLHTDQFTGRPVGLSVVVAGHR